MRDPTASTKDEPAASWRGFSLMPLEMSSIGLACIGLAIAVGYLLLHVAFDAVVMALWGFPPGELPLWQNDQWWTDFVNAALIGYLPAAQAMARRDVARDLAEMRPRLRCNAAEFNELSDASTGPGGPIARALSLSGLVVGAWITFFDPSVAFRTSVSPSDPWFVWTLGRLILMIWLISRFAVYDFNVTRIYRSLGRNSVRIDLLDIRSLAPFARRGQRSALTWVIFSSILSLFWLGDSAAQANLPGLVLILSMAAFAFIGPLAGLSQGIRVAKHAELERLRDQIRAARAETDTAGASPRLANLTGYYQLIDNASEWPIDAANLLKFIGYLLLGLGSWLGGAVVERILDSAIRS
jgi:hypothetical protein